MDSIDLFRVLISVLVVLVGIIYTFIHAAHKSYTMSGEEDIDNALGKKIDFKEMKKHLKIIIFILVLTLIISI